MDFPFEEDFNNISIVPDSVEAATLVRIDSLGQVETQILQVASVIGEGFSSSLVKAVFPATYSTAYADVSEEPVLAALQSANLGRSAYASDVTADFADIDRKVCNRALEPYAPMPD